MSGHAATYAAFLLMCMFAVMVSAFAQGSANPSKENWRPKDGIYAGPGKDFDSQCRNESGDIIIELAEKSVSGYEWGCEINKVTNTAPEIIKLNMTCNDINMPESEG